jgi:hypothetical protein
MSDSRPTHTSSLLCDIAPNIPVRIFHINTDPEWNQDPTEEPEAVKPIDIGPARTIIAERYVGQAGAVVMHGATPPPPDTHTHRYIHASTYISEMTLLAIWGRTGSLMSAPNIQRQKSMKLHDIADGHEIHDHNETKKSECPKGEPGPFHAIQGHIRLLLIHEGRIAR